MWKRIIITGLLVAAALPQTPASAEFEVARVKRNTLDDRIVTINVGPGGRFACRGYTLVLLIQRAYGVMDWNVTGGPPWIRADRFDIEARANVAGNLKEWQLQPMLQALLAKRFRLKVHRGMQEMPGYAMTIAPGGSKLRPSATEENRENFRFGSDGLSGQGITMYDFTRFVIGKLGLVGIDQTGLKGGYDFDAHWKVEPDPSAEDPKEPLRVAVIAALQEQLGLKLVAKRVPVPTIVIEHAERATASEN
jgi:uncharacterized protein (TIGR03435 family)